MSGRATTAYVDRDRNDGVLDHAAGESGGSREASTGPRLLESAAFVRAHAQYTYRGGSGRPALQLQRETARASAPVVGQFRERGQARGGNTENQPGSAGGNDRDYALQSQLFHEQIPATWLYRIQRYPRSSQFAHQCR